MDIETALNEINSFWCGEPLPFGHSDNGAHFDRIAAEFELPIPAELEAYLRHAAPAVDFCFDTVGNPLRIYGIENLGRLQDGYSWNSRTGQALDGWPASYFIIADEGADPVIIDLEDPAAGVQKLQHGAGSWEYGETVADTIGQFLLCSAAQHRALNDFEAEPIIDDEKGFNLAPAAAKWYFDKMKAWAGDYYEAWCSVFDNS